MRKKYAEECLMKLTAFLKERSARLEELIDYYERIEEVRGYLISEEKAAYFKALDQFSELGNTVAFLVSVLEPEKKVDFLGIHQKDGKEKKQK